MGFAVIAGAPGIVSAQGSDRYVIERGSVIPLTLNDKLSSRDSLKGDTFSATIDTHGHHHYFGIPEGVRIEGVVYSARPKHGHDPGVLDLDFVRLRLPDGRTIPITGSLIGLDSKSVRSLPDGRLVARPAHTDDRLTYLGYGAGAGFVIGALTHRAVRDTVLGASIGALFGALEGHHTEARDVVLTPGTEMGVRIDSRVEFKADGPKLDTHEETGSYRVKE
jgi:hypothetical protein